MPRLTLLLAVLSLLLPTLARAQGAFGIGPRVTFVRGSSDVPDSGQRLLGGSLRLGGGATAIEVAMDYRSEVTGSLTERVKSYPIQGSLLLVLGRASLAPYLLAGVGWYSQRVEVFQAPTGTTVLSDETTRKMGYHAGFGAEVRPSRRVGIYGDYRYTKIRLGDDAGSSSLLPSFLGGDRLRVSHEGSAFTWGAMVYF